jgi:hypothetical protein
MAAGRKPAAWKFQRRDNYNGPTFWAFSETDPTNHSYRAPGGLIIPLYESEADSAAVSPARAALTLAAFDALEREAVRPIRDAKDAVRTAARKRL